MSSPPPRYPVVQTIDSGRVPDPGRIESRRPKPHHHPRLDLVLPCPRQQRLRPRRYKVRPPGFLLPFHPLEADVNES